EEGEMLVEAGARNAPVFIVKTGQIDLVQPPGTDEHVIGSLTSGQFSGEAGMLSGRPRLVRVRVARAGELIELQREQLMSLIQTDSELSEIFMRAFILRRVELIAQQLGDVVLLGSNHSAGT